MDLLSQEQISEFKEAFNMFADGGDVITKDTLAPVMKQMGRRPPQAWLALAGSTHCRPQLPC